MNKFKDTQDPHIYNDGRPECSLVRDYIVSAIKGTGTVEEGDSDVIITPDGFTVMDYLAGVEYTFVMTWQKKDAEEALAQIRGVTKS